MDIKDEQKKVQGTFPEGKLNNNDTGALMLKVGIEDGNVRIDFGEPTSWIAFPPAMSIHLAQELIKRARQAGFNGPVQIEF